MTFNGWNYSIFLPILVALLLLIAFWGAKLKYQKTAYLLSWTIAFWFAALSIVLTRLWGGLFLSAGPKGISLYFGYMVGGAMVSLVPFVLILIMLNIFQGNNISSRRAMAMAALSAFILMLLFPPFFFIGSLVGCVMGGGKTCM